MDTTSRQYVVERQDASDAAWCRVALCRCLRYAELLAATGLRRHIGIAYRAVERSTGAETPLCAKAQATAA